MKRLSKAERERAEEVLASIVENFDNEDRVVREFALRKIRRLKLYWNSFSQIYWSETAKDYRILGFNYDDSRNDQAYYDRPINVFRAFLETIIAAMSIQVPAPNCVPDNADNPNDVSTARAGNNIGELLFKHNDVLFLWLHALYVHCTEGMVACHTYVKEDKAYGTYQEKQYKDEEIEAYQCVNCGSLLPDDIFQVSEQLKFEEFDEFAPDDSDVALHSELNGSEEGVVCPDCSVLLDPSLQKSKVIVPRFVGMIDKPKGRVCFSVKGGMNVKIAAYAREQSETPYLIDSYETHYANALEMFPKKADCIPDGGESGDPYDWTVRLNPIYHNGFPDQVVTIKKAWIRPAGFNVANDDPVDSDVKFLKKHFPDGVRVTLVNDVIVAYENESLDDSWTITRNPMFDFLIHEPLGELVVNVQDITNDLISLTLQTIEHGVAQTWADPSVVDFGSYGQVEAAPGTITQTKTSGSGKSIKDAFFTTQTASLNPEIFQFYNIVQQLGQFVSGALPAIYGGQQASGSSRTASEYAMARTNALQRLSTTWRMFTLWWKAIFGKAIPAYIKLVKEDERYVKKDPNGNFINVWIRKTELTGKIGDIEVENSEQMPVSDEQKADIVMRLMELNNVEVMQSLTSPENLPFIRKVVKMPEFKLAGEDDRQKQYEEITVLVNSEPIVMPPEPVMAAVAAQNGIPLEPMELPSVEVDPLVDNHLIESQICRSWLVSEAGRLAKIENPLGYKNVLLHYKQHLQILAQQQIEQEMSANMAAGNSNNSPQGEKPKGKGPEETQIEDSNAARTPIQ